MLEPEARCRPRSRSRGSTGSPPARPRPGRPASPPRGSPGAARPRCGPRAAPRRRRGGGGRPRRATAPRRPAPPPTGRGRSCSDHSWKVPPARQTRSMTAPTRRSPRLAIPSAAVASGSCQRMVRPRVPRAGFAQQLDLAVELGDGVLAEPLERRVGLGHEPADRGHHGDRAVVAPADLDAASAQLGDARARPRPARSAGRSGSRASPGASPGRRRRRPRRRGPPRGSAC